ncbi:MAG TPA: DUF1653 domain-containing protein [Candidatus Eisenbergiella merdigallinarum]|uniref:DUF1653 domain-containing protein n=1 Tax=Candidatus Eisenbergiella merdigallinarum TaxID=2838552 RepID=A0A9D2SEH6_9FIRM|nr:DUF1653 domain-containing protein [Candidatus Eisenbergiella merdigallinarum]
MRRIPGQGEIYRHFKGNLYRIVTLAQHAETGEQLVVYQGLYGDYPVYARPLSLFLGEVDREKYSEAQDRYRFTLIPEAGTLAGAPAAGTPVPPSEEAGASAGPDAQLKPAGEPSEREEAKPGTAPEGAGPAADEEAFELDPGLLAFLEADSYEKKLEVFDQLAGRADQKMLNTMAVSLDLELSEGSLEEQYEALKNCLLTLERYECNRLR